MSAPAASPKKVKKAPKPKVLAAHPPYSKMVVEAIKALKERGGSSRIAILKYITQNYYVTKDEKKVNTFLKMALRRGCDANTLKHGKGGVGAIGSFMVRDKKITEAKPKAKKPAATKVKVKTAKKAKTAKPKASKPKTAAKKHACTRAKTPRKVKAVKPAAKKTQKIPKTSKPKKA